MGVSLTLQQRLTIRTPLGPPSQVQRLIREQICGFIRTIEPQIFQADGETRAALRELLGWDDATFHAFITSPLLTHSSPHVSMNAFAPMLTFPWMQRCIQTLARAPGAGSPVHLRTLVMHNNLGDLRWRPYAWWRRSTAGAIVKTALFSRSQSFRRKVVLSQPAPRIDVSDCVASDRDAVRLAGHARNYAYFAAIYRMQLERLAGFHHSHGTIEIPLNILNAFTFSRGNAAPLLALAGERAEWGARTIDGNGELVALAADDIVRIAAQARDLEKFPVICANTLNFAQVYQFGISAMIGAEKMARYVAPMNEEIEALNVRIGWSSPVPDFIPITRVPEPSLGQPDAPSQRALQGHGIKCPLSIYVADQGDGLAGRLQALLSKDYAEFLPAEGH
jgi:hypothetical protein